MKPIYQCGYCRCQGIEDHVKEHEKTCYHNPKVHGCGSCAHHSWKKTGIGWFSDIDMICGLGLTPPASVCGKWEHYHTINSNLRYA